ncbi:MAG: response regulator [Myxococcales bacterium]|nr:response regulator [Myxococcales bacterium]
MIRTALRRALRGAGYRVVEAEDGEVAVARLRAEAPFAAMTLDMDMPKKRGSEVLVEALALQPELRVLVIAGHLDADDKRALLAAGAAACFDKPFDPEAVLATLAPRP